MLPNEILLFKLRLIPLSPSDIQVAQITVAIAVKAIPNLLLTNSILLMEK